MVGFTGRGPADFAIWHPPLNLASLSEGMPLFRSDTTEYLFNANSQYK
jgi:hypothetical protein